MPIRKTRATRLQKGFVSHKENTSPVTEKATTRVTRQQLKNITNEKLKSSQLQPTVKIQRMKVNMPSITTEEGEKAGDETAQEEEQPQHKRKISEPEPHEGTGTEDGKEGQTSPSPTKKTKGDDEEQEKPVATDVEEPMETTNNAPTEDASLSAVASENCIGNEQPSTSKNSKTQTSPTKQSGGDILPAKLLTILSNLYLDTATRLRLDFPPRCAEDLSHCHKHHYSAPMSEAPSHTQAFSLRSALQQQRYISFVNFAMDMCHRGEFPGQGIFTKLIELLLSINSSGFNNVSHIQLYSKSIELFSSIVFTFPPCWLAMRHFYVDLFQKSLDPEKIASKDKPPLSKSTKLIDILLDLLEKTLEQCSTEELHETNFDNDTATRTSKADANPTLNSENSPATAPNSMDMSGCSEIFNYCEWEESENRLQTFEALNLGRRLDRLFVVLRLLLQILESDLVMWILHHHKKAKHWIFHNATRPLVVIVYELTAYNRLSTVIRRLFTLFATSVNKGLSDERLHVFERYIALLMVASNTADMEHTVIGVKFPNLCPETKTLIREFFKIFKTHNTSNISSYIKTIDILRIPFLRYEFIDHFLQLFYFPKNEVMCPKKIAYDIAKKRWLRYLPLAELQSSGDEDLPREQYLRLLLLALEAYSEWHGSKTLIHHMKKGNAVEGFKTYTDSVHRWPTNGTDVLVLRKMMPDMAELEKKLKLKVRMSRPKVDLHVVDICIDGDVMAKYRDDLKYILIMRDMIPKLAETNDNVDFSEWSDFLSDCAPK